MSFPWSDYTDVTKEASEIIRDRDGKGRNDAVGFYEGYPHGHQDVSFELARRVGRVLGAEKAECLMVARADALDLLNYAAFYVMVLDRENGVRLVDLQKEQVPLKPPTFIRQA